jgi:hypothetical protein
MKQTRSRDNNIINVIFTSFLMIVTTQRWFWWQDLTFIMFSSTLKTGDLKKCVMHADGGNVPLFLLL